MTRPFRTSRGPARARRTLAVVALCGIGAPFACAASERPPGTPEPRATADASTFMTLFDDAAPLVPPPPPAPRVGVEAPPRTEDAGPGTRALPPGARPACRQGPNGALAGRVLREAEVNVGCAPGGVRIDDHGATYLAATRFSDWRTAYQTLCIIPRPFPGSADLSRFDAGAIVDHFTQPLRSIDWQKSDVIAVVGESAVLVEWGGVRRVVIGGGGCRGVPPKPLVWLFEVSRGEQPFEERCIEPGCSGPGPFPP